MGIELRSSLSRSTCWTCLRSATKCDDSISEASAESRGAQRLPDESERGRGQSATFAGARAGSHADARLAKGDVTLHLVDVDLADGLTPRRSVHVDVHDVLCDRPVAVLVVVVLDDEDHVEPRENRCLEVDVLERADRKQGRASVSALQDMKLCEVVAHLAR